MCDFRKVFFVRNCVPLRLKTQKIFLDFWRRKIQLRLLGTGTEGEKFGEALGKSFEYLVQNLDN